MALVSVAGISATLLLLTMAVTSDVFSLRRMVLQYEYQAAAALAADACAQSVVLRIIHKDAEALAPARITLSSGRSCRIDHVEQAGSVYTIQTSANVGSAKSRQLTEIEVTATGVQYLISRKI